jgi:DNA helicase HerA-like ATPase
MVLLGTSGAGKTFTLQLIALRMRRKGTQVFIIAPLKGHEFLRACNNIGGEFISISPASKQCINVCEIRKQDLSANQLIDGVISENSILAKKIQQLHIFFSLLIPDISHEERQLLDEALIRTYAKKGITHNNESLIDPEHPDRYREMPLLGDIYEILMESPETRRMGNILNRLVNGSAKTFSTQMSSSTISTQSLIFPS